MNLTAPKTARQDETLSASRHRYTRIALLFLLALVLAPAVAIQANPRLTIANPRFDFGFVPMNCDVTYRYWLHSTGSSDLHIKWTDASCPCAQMPLEKKVLPPDDSVALELILTTGRVVGAVTRKPYIQTDADAEPARVEFTAKVIPGDPKEAIPLGVRPFRAELSEIGPYAQDTAHITMYNNAEYPMELSLVYSDSMYFSVTLPESIRPGDSGICEVVLNRGEPKATDSAFAKSFTVEIALRVVGDNTSISRFTVPVRRKYSPRK